LLPIASTTFLIPMLLFALIGLESNQMTRAQQRDDVSLMQDPLLNRSTQMSEVANRLNTISERFDELKQGQIVTVYLFVIAFMMGLAFVIFGLYIGQEHKLSLFTKRLYLIAYFALVIPVTAILLRYMANTLLSGALNDPILTVAFILLIPVARSYILMVVKYRHEIVRTP
jgi:hypothetical protein